MQDTHILLYQRIVRAKESQDSIGGTITCVIRNLPSGLGEPCFDKFEALLAHAMLSIPATKAFEIGSGFKGTEVQGSKHNDPFVLRESGGLGTVSNWSGGVQGGITNGENVYFRFVQYLTTTDIVMDNLLNLLSELDSNLPPQYRVLRTPHNTMVLVASWRREGDMILVWFLVRYPLSKQWPA